MENKLHGLAILLACFVCAFAEFDLSNANLNDLQNSLPSEFSNPNETINNIRTLVRDKCISVAGDEKGTQAYNEIETGVISLGECLTSLVNMSAIQKEIDDAKPNGELDAVFHKYCNKRPEALTCVENFNAKLVPCFDKDEQENQDVVMRIVRSLLSFVCHKGGDQIALFIAEQGPECLESKKEEIQQCLNNTFSGYVPKDGFDNVKTLPKFVMAEKQCDDIERLETCIVEHLEKCSEITPANIVESMFRFIKNETICRNKPTSQRHSLSKASSVLLSGFNAIAAIVSIVFFFGINKFMQ